MAEKSYAAPETQPRAAQDGAPHVDGGGHIHAPTDGIVLSESIHDPVDAEPRGGAIDFFFSGPFFAGDCKLAAATLTAFSDGTAHWRANTVMSTSGDDSWLATFEFFDRNGLSLWRFGRISSPSLSPPHAVITWVSANQLFYHAHLFPQIARVSMTYRC
ncbi:DUF6294 family protein [Streptomyces sp. NPDC060035]|uniref:DUF6294 family protein n=1 Tax=Streptomyces sp. NPDC060035 TaxID=3347044 RepID=UPI0036840064